MLNDILNALVALMQADTALSEIQSYHKVEGMVPGLESTVSVWVPKQRFTEYTNDEDEAEADIHIGLAIQDIDAESGESRIRDLSEEIRLLLTADDHTLGGLIDDSFMSEWEFATFNAKETETVHLGEAVWQVKYYAPRYRTNTATEVDEVDIEDSIYINSGS